MVKKYFSSIWGTIANRILIIFMSSVLVVLLISFVFKTDIILHKIFFIILTIGIIYIVLLLNIKLKVLSIRDEVLYIGLFNKREISNLKVIKTLRGNAPIVIYSYELDTKLHKSFSMVKVFQDKKIFEELKNYKRFN